MKLNSYETLVGFVWVTQELQHHHSAKAMVAQDLLICFVDIPPLTETDPDDANSEDRCVSHAVASFTHREKNALAE